MPSPRSSGEPSSRAATRSTSNVARSRSSSAERSRGRSNGECARRYARCSNASTSSWPKRAGRMATPACAPSARARSHRIHSGHGADLTTSPARRDIDSTSNASSCALSTTRSDSRLYVRGAGGEPVRRPPRSSKSAHRQLSRSASPSTSMMTPWLSLRTNPVRPSRVASE